MEAGQQLWERDTQLTAAAATLDAARAGRGGALFLLGEAGLGKTSVLDRVCAQAEPEVVVARATCDPMQSALPFGLLWQIVHGLGGQVAGGSDDDAAQARSAFFYRTLRQLEDAASGPVLIAVDDLQWSDPDSLVFVALLCRRLAHMPMAVVASMRPWPPAAADLAWSVVERGGAAIEPLAPLSEQGAADALAQRLGRPVSGELAQRGWRLTGGNPLLLDLAARQLDEGTWTESDIRPVSDVERSLVLRRFAGLTPDGTRWVRAAAVLGVEFQPELVGEVAGLEANAVDVAADAVWRARLVRTRPHGRAEFVHPLFWQLLYEDTAPPVRARLHARAFTALADRGMDDAAAEQAVRADLTGDSRTVRVLTETGQRALRAGATATAVSRLEAAVRLSGNDIAAPLIPLGEAYLEAGRGLEAAPIVTKALHADLPPAERVAAYEMLSRAQYGQGDLEGARVGLEEAVALAEQECPEKAVHPLIWFAAAVQLTAGPAAALPVATRARDLSRGGDPAIEGAVNSLWGLLAYTCGDPEGLAVAESEATRVLAAGAAEVAADLRSGYSGTLGPYAMAACYGERFTAAESILLSGIDEAERAGLLTTASAFWVLYGLTVARTRSTPLRPVADRLLAFTDLIPLSEPYARPFLSYELLESGEDRESEVEHARARPLASASSIWKSELWLDHIEGLRLLRRGQFQSASAIYLGLEERYRSLGLGEPCIVPFGRHAVLAHGRAGRLADAERVAGWLEERANVLGCRWPASAAAAGRASLAVERGDLAEADERYRAAIELLADVSLPLDQAEIMIEHGTVLRRAGRPREARESFRRAAALADAGGGVWIARHASDELAAAGGRKREPRAAHELTPQEQRAARLAATGASDKEIAAQLAVSVHTVRTHLDRVYTKLGLHSRRELMTMGDQLEATIGRLG